MTTEHNQQFILNEEQMNTVKGILVNFFNNRGELLNRLMGPAGDHDKIDQECRYPRTEELSADYFRTLYDRDPIAARVVELMPMECWQESPSVYEKEDSKSATQFEKDWDELGQDLSAGGTSWHAGKKGSPVWMELKKAHILSGIGQFGVILLGLDDGRNLQDPADGASIVVNWAPEIVRNEKGESVYSRIVNKGKREIPVDSPPKKSEIDAINKFEERKVVNERYTFDQHGNLKHPDDAKWWEGREKDPSDVVTNSPGNVLRPWQPNYGRRDTVDKQTTAYQGGIGGAIDAKPDKDLPGKNVHGFARSDSAPSFPAFVQGTDRQHDMESGIGMAPPFFATGRPGGKDVSDVGPPVRPYGTPEGAAQGSLMGTDQQYFGVQFGPSETYDDQPSKKSHKLLFLRSFDESLVQVVRYEWSVRSQRFGLPVMYRITLNDPRQQHGGVGLPIATVYVHWSRVIHISNAYNTSSPLFAKPEMLQVLNEILNRRKVSGAAAEGYWRTCFTKISLESIPQLGGDVDVSPTIPPMMEDFFNNLRSWIGLTGFTAKSLAPSVVDPTPHIDKAIEAICIKKGCPVRVFKGSERGELASSQDDESWNERKKGYNDFFTTPCIIVQFVNRLIQLGVLSEPEEWYCEWPDFDTLGKKDVAAIALQEVQSLAAFIAGNGETMCTPTDFYVRFLRWSEEQAKAVIDAATVHVQEKQDDAQDLADEHGFEPQPPEGFAKPPPPIPPGMNPASNKPPNAFKSQPPGAVAAAKNPPQKSPKE